MAPPVIIATPPATLTSYTDSFTNTRSIIAGVIVAVIALMFLGLYLYKRFILKEKVTRTDILNFFRKNRTQNRKFYVEGGVQVPGSPTYIRTQTASGEERVIVFNTQVTEES
jgi:hypothetical protein